MLVCSLLFFSWICFPPQPIICEPKIYEKENYNLSAIATAYTLSEDETDGSPTIGAWGDDLSKIPGCVVATRLYKRGTVLDIKNIGGRCVVLDKTSKKYAERIDILFPTKVEALKFGKKTIKYKVIN